MRTGPRKLRNPQSMIDRLTTPTPRVSTRIPKYLVYSVPLEEELVLPSPGTRGRVA